MNNAIYEIVKITDRDGNDRTDGRYPLRIGRKCKPCICGPKGPAFLQYLPPIDGTVKASRIESLENNNKYLTITTRNSVYHLKEVTEE